MSQINVLFGLMAWHIVRISEVAKPLLFRCGGSSPALLPLLEETSHFFRGGGVLLSPHPAGHEGFCHTVSWLSVSFQFKHMRVKMTLFEASVLWFSSQLINPIFQTLTCFNCGPLVFCTLWVGTFMPWSLACMLPSPHTPLSFLLCFLLLLSVQLHYTSKCIEMQHEIWLRATKTF